MTRRADPPDRFPALAGWTTRTSNESDMKRPTIMYYTVNAITMYRLVSAPFLLLLAFLGELDLFRWLVAASFLTDAIDGPLSRMYRVSSVFGSRLDSIADDATVFVSTIGLWLIDPEFIREEWLLIVGLLALFGLQTISALIAYKKVTSFHTYMAKIAAVVQAVFFISFFFKLGPSYIFFCIAVVITAMELIEEIVLVLVLPEWKTNVKGLYWVLKARKHLLETDK